MEFWPSYDVIRRTCKDSREGILHSCNLVSISALMFHVVHRCCWPMRHHDSRSISSVDFRFVVIALSEYVAVFIPLWSSARNLQGKQRSEQTHLKHDAVVSFDARPSYQHYLLGSLPVPGHAHLKPF